MSIQNMRTIWIIQYIVLHCEKLEMYCTGVERVEVQDLQDDDAQDDEPDGLHAGKEILISDFVS